MESEDGRIQLPGRSNNSQQDQRNLEPEIQDADMSERHIWTSTHAEATVRGSD